MMSNDIKLQAPAMILQDYLRYRELNVIALSRTNNFLKHIAYLFEPVKCNQICLSSFRRNF